MFMDFFDVLFKTLDIATRPIGWVKYSVNSLGSLKKEVCSFLNSYYQVDTFNYKDYAVRVHAFGGFYIYHKKTGKAITRSTRTNTKYIEIDLDNMMSREFPEKQLSELNKFCKVKERIYLSYEDSKITQVQNTITLVPHHVADIILDDEEVYVDICVIKDSNNKVIKLYKELYNFVFMHGNRLSLVNYSNNYNIEDIFNDIIKEKNAVI